MLARSAVRASVRRTPFTPARFQSTTTEKAAEAAKDTASKAAQGLSRVTSAAGPAISGAAKGVAGALGKVGGRTGKVVGFVESTFLINITKAIALLLCARWGDCWIQLETRVSELISCDPSRVDRRCSPS